MSRGYESAVRTEQAEATRRRIIDAVVAYLSAGDTSWSMQDVADRAGVSARTVYRHFASRDELVDGVIAGINEDIAGQLPGAGPGSIEELTAFAPVAFRWVADHEDLYRVLLSTELGRTAHRRRTGLREAELRSALAGLLDGLDEPRARRLLGVFHLLASSNAVLFLRDHWQLDHEDAARAVSWAMRVLAEAAADPERSAGL